MHRTRVDRPAIAATAVAFLATLTLAWLALAQSDSEEVTRTCSAEGYCPGWTRGVPIQRRACVLLLH